MRTVRGLMVTTRCSSFWSPKWTSLMKQPIWEPKLSSDNHQMSLVGVWSWEGSQVWFLQEWARGSQVWFLGRTRARGVLYSEVQCIMGNGHIGTSPKQNKRQTLPALLILQSFCLPLLTLWVTAWYAPVLSPTNACSHICGREWLGCHVDYQRVSRCHARGESQGTCNTYSSAKHE